MSTSRPPVNTPVTRERNWAVWVLVILAVVAGILALVDAARYMGWLPFSIQIMDQDLSFVLPSAQWFAAIMSAIVGVIYFAVAAWLYNLNPQGWLFVVVIAVINLVFLFLALLGTNTFGDILWQVIVNALLLILAMLPSTQAAFGRTGGKF